MMVPAPRTFAKAAWDKLGSVAFVSPCLPHAVFELMGQIMPKFIIAAALRKPPQPKNKTQ
jgi:hypothetical protein